MPPFEHRLRPAAEAGRLLLDTVAADLRAHGEWEEIAGLPAAALARGSSAARHRLLGHAHGALTEVARTLVEETTRYTDPPLRRGDVAA
jgi:hypothetical protein